MSNRARLIIYTNLSLSYKCTGTISVVYNRLTFTYHTVSWTNLITIRSPYFLFYHTLALLIRFLNFKSFPLLAYRTPPVVL
nr:MAG TPA: hypothetical protein [Caudoviricetes sp.]